MMTSASMAATTQPITAIGWLALVSAGLMAWHCSTKPHPRALPGCLATSRLAEHSRMDWTAGIARRWWPSLLQRRVCGRLSSMDPWRQVLLGSTYHRAGRSRMVWMAGTAI